MENLQRVDLKVYSDEECERIHALTSPASREYHVCAGVDEGGKGQCNVSTVFKSYLDLIILLY